MLEDQNKILALCSNYRNQTNVFNQIGNHSSSTNTNVKLTPSQTPFHSLRLLSTCTKANQQIFSISQMQDSINRGLTY